MKTTLASQTWSILHVYGVERKALWISGIKCNPLCFHIFMLNPGFMFRPFQRQSITKKYTTRLFKPKNISNLLFFPGMLLQSPFCLLVK